MKSRLKLVAGSLVLITLVAVAYYRAGVLNLPSVPDGISAADAGLNALGELKAFDENVASGNLSTEKNALVVETQGAIAEIKRGKEEVGIHHLQSLVQREPKNLVLGNLLRMETYSLIRRWLAANASHGELALNLPEYLDHQPAVFFRNLLKQRNDREIKLQLAMSLVDHMLLFPALEIKAPASVEAVEVLSEILSASDSHDTYYVPALYARGLNYLYRPFNLVWPERIAAIPDAASKDISLAIALGQKIGAGSDNLKSELSLALGDAYAKEGKLSAARSWWQLANNLVHDDRTRQRVFARLQWKDEDVASNLEAMLEEQMNDTDHPMSDLRFMWQ